MSDALAQIAMPVAVVAAASGGARSCSTGTLTYVSYSPPLVATPLNAGSRTYALLRESGQFSLSLLAADQAELAVRAASPSEDDKFTEQSIPVHEPPPGLAAPGVEGAVTILWCGLESVSEAGAYVLCVGRIRDSLSNGKRPLLRYAHRYHELGADVSVEVEARYPL